MLNAYSGDTLVVVKEVKHYFRPTFYIDYYGSAPRDLDINLNNINTQNRTQLLNRYYQKNRRKTNNELYSFRLTNIGGAIPIYTKTYITHEYLRPTLSILATGNMLIAQPNFDFLYDKDFGYRSHRLHKVSVGVRFIHTNGKKNTWFINFSPFVSQDQYTFEKPTLRWWGGVIFCRTVSQKFSYRIGLIKTYLLAEQGFMLPFVGVRLGSLDNINVNISIPRNISLNIPALKNKLYLSIYTRPIGGVFNYNNIDNSIKELAPVARLEPFLDTARIGTEIQYRFQEILFGIQAEYKFSDNISAYVSIGTATQRKVGFAINASDMIAHRIGNDETKGILFNADNTLFLSFGCNVTLGKTKKTDNNYLMYDAFQMNKLIDAGDNNTGSRYLYNDKKAENDVKTIKKSDIDYRDVKDLIYEYE
ncbi:MAG: DUF6268 family outer membrane beta-barrel protein [Cytophagales bacterium]|nr:DUF6268 family outer membrane beta-barrel protein [Cytophagales bacterium]